MEPKMSCATSNRIMFRLRKWGSSNSSNANAVPRRSQTISKQAGPELGDVFDAQKPYWLRLVIKRGWKHLCKWRLQGDKHQGFPLPCYRRVPKCSHIPLLSCVEVKIDSLIVLRSETHEKNYSRFCFILFLVATSNNSWSNVFSLLRLLCPFFVRLLLGHKCTSNHQVPSAFIHHLRLQGWCSDLCGVVIGCH